MSSELLQAMCRSELRGFEQTRDFVARGWHRVSRSVGPVPVTQPFRNRRAERCTLRSGLQPLRVIGSIAVRTGTL